MENNKAERMKEICKLVAEKGFKQWFSDYSEKHHSLKGWLEYDQYLDEVELPEELSLCLIQKWLRDVYNIDVWTVPFMNENIYSFIIFKDKLDITEEIPEFGTFKEALIAGIKETVKTI